MKLPDIPGSIIAQMAMAPERKINQYVVGVSAGERDVIKIAVTNQKVANAKKL